MARHIQFTEYTDTGSVQHETQDEYQEKQEDDWNKAAWQA